MAWTYRCPYCGYVGTSGTVSATGCSRCTRNINRRKHEIGAAPMGPRNIKPLKITDTEKVAPPRKQQRKGMGPAAAAIEAPLPLERDELVEQTHPDIRRHGNRRTSRFKVAQHSRVKWNKQRMIDGRVFTRFKMYGDTPAELERARADAQTLRDNNPMHVRILKFSNGYHMFTWTINSKKIGRGQKWGPDPMPTSGMVDNTRTKFYRRYGRR